MTRKHILIYIVISCLAFAACNADTTKSKKQAVVTDSTKQKELIKSEPEIIDSGQVWFKVTVTKNDTPYINYEGTWPLLLSSNNSATLQLAASKKLMSITNMLTVYFHGLPPVGVKPIDISGRDKNNISMVMSQVINGSYDIPILPGEGVFTVTKNTGTVLSGYFNAKAVDAEKNNYKLTGTFLNIEVNNSDYIK